jgi:peroxiredoxin
MAGTPSYMLPLGTEAPDFTIPNTVNGKEVSLSQIRGSNGTLIIFMCNHCPYVLHLLDKIIEISSEIIKSGINTVAISSNDVENYPDDSPELMKKLAEDRAFSFPYLYDKSQSVALSYQAACTPDFYLFDSELKLVYRGRFDDARPKNELPVTGRDLLDAAQKLAHGVPQIENQTPSLGCNIKWKKGNEPGGFFS